MGVVALKRVAGGNTAMPYVNVECRGWGCRLMMRKAQCYMPTRSAGRGEFKAERGATACP